MTDWHQGLLFGFVGGALTVLAFLLALAEVGP